MAHRILHTSLLGAAALCALASLASAQGDEPVADPQLAAARALYRPDTWPLGQARVGLGIAALELEGFQGTAPRAIGAQVLRRFQHADGGAAFQVELLVADELAGAREQLLLWVAGVSSPEAVPRAAEQGIAVGEVGYVGRSRYGAEHPLWVAFVRGNVAVRVMAHDLRGDDRPSMAAVARRVDAALLEERLLEDGEAVPRPAVTTFAAAKAVPKAGDSVPLSLAVDATVLGFELAGGATGYVEQAGDGSWTLYTTGAGELGLTVVTLAQNGTVGRATLPLVVAPE